MISRLRGNMSRLLSAAAAHIRHVTRPAGPVVKGHMMNVIVVKPPDPRFKEAVFVLKDDYFMNAELSRQELLLQAQDAAREYVWSAIPPVRRRFPPLLAVLLTAAAVMVIFYFAKNL